MNLLNKLSQNAVLYPHKKAVINEEEKASFTYAELELYSDRLARHIAKMLSGGGIAENRCKIVVYGHKNPYMLVVFLACVKAGFSYCPIDVSSPPDRTLEIVKDVEPPIIFAVEGLPLFGKNIIDFATIKNICASDRYDRVEMPKELAGDSVFYTLFTSGSTGKPKGVEITYDNLNSFLRWTNELISDVPIAGLVFINQAPLSFDLSVMDVYSSLYMGGTLYMINKDIQMNFSELFAALEKSKAAVWVSTPSFAEMCLSDRKFSQALMPYIKIFLFCGEVLTNSTALKIMERFPQARVVNTFGPTETTVAVTAQHITEEIAKKDEPLPIGKAKPGTEVEIWDQNLRCSANNEIGEIVIIGDTVGKGYFNNEAETKRVFLTVERKGTSLRAYRTGDMGYFDDDNILHYCGRMDKQIKLNGYRIEIGDIEENLLKNQDISGAVVLPKGKDGKVKSLTAFITLYDFKTGCREKARQIREELKNFLPEYMIPKKIIFLERIPMNNNGKTDRKKLEEML